LSAQAIAVTTTTNDQALTTIHALLISPSPRVLLAADGPCTRNFILTSLPSIMTRLRRILRFLHSLWWQQFNPFLTYAPSANFTSSAECASIQCKAPSTTADDVCNQKTLTISLTRKYTCKRMYSKNARFRSRITLHHGVSTSRSVFPRAAAIADGGF
jgi:hypothetical protein